MQLDISCKIIFFKWVVTLRTVSHVSSSSCFDNLKHESMYNPSAIYECMRETNGVFVLKACDWP